MSNCDITLKVSDFTPTPGARYEWETPGHSGEEFREQLLEPAFLEALDKECTLWVNLDGVAGYGPSFVDESFGHLARKYGAERVDAIICFVSSDNPFNKEYVESVIEEQGERNHA